MLPVSDRFNEYGASVRERLREQGLRVELDDRGESVPRKVRDAELRRVPYMLVVASASSARARCRCASTGLEARAAHLCEGSRSGWRHTCNGAYPRLPRPSCARTDSPGGGVQVGPESDGRPEAPLARCRRAVILGRLEEFPHPIFCVPRHRIGLTRRQDS